ncbi:MAG TPA: hypothetical protein VG502_17295 [Flexivirga sp.]|uniref:hypothetical protein n=1 Tax=Flexivirga sp. TaxID=1962927 RepID=UPI002CF94922|nr:hypothetical protein [Flexivirga sp.]HWC24054.1 hypothetical protein [Flexivirga sp.]
MEQKPTSVPSCGSDEFQALASAVRAYDRLVQQAHTAPVAADPVELLAALSVVGEASVVMVRRAGAL